MTDRETLARWRAGTERGISGDGSVFMSRRYDAGIEAVWSAWTDPERLSRAALATAR
jgi:hypothetical protein